MSNIQRVFGIDMVPRHSKYLGLPLSISRNRRDVFASISAWVSGVVPKWKDKLISSAEKEVLIKAVAQAIPNYTISIFRLPKVVVD